MELRRILNKQIPFQKAIPVWPLCWPVPSATGLRSAPMPAMASCAWANQIDPEDMDACQGCRPAMVSGYVSVEARDRMRLERLMRYAARPAVATGRLSELSDGRLHYRLKRPWRDGTTAVVFERQDFIAKLAVVVPAPRAHLTRYHGVFGPAAAWRSLIVPTGNGHSRETELKSRPSLQTSNVPTSAEDESQTAPAVSGRNYTWAELMNRVFLVDL